MIKGKLYPGCRIKPMGPNGFKSWYPSIQVVSYDNVHEAHVVFSDGRHTDSFNLGGWMSFEVMEEESLENK